MGTIVVRAKICRPLLVYAGFRFEVRVDAIGVPAKRLSPNTVGQIPHTVSAQFAQIASTADAWSTSVAMPCLLPGLAADISNAFVTTAKSPLLDVYHLVSTLNS